MLRRFLILLFLIGVVGCVERTITINSEPKGALVYLNDKEVGRTPVTVPFQWYGDYDVILRKDGFEPLKTHNKVVQPWYEYIPADIFAELFYPGTIHDDHLWEFELKTREPTNVKELQQRALDIQSQARGSETPSTQPGDGKDKTEKN
ncbi:MAG: PEGA domain-containing protein [Phycisphaerae bacterium]